MAVEGPSLKLNPIIPQKGGKQRGNNRSIRYPKLPPRCTFAGRICVTRHGGLKLNYSPETIGRHERGDVPVSPDDIIRYAEGYQRPDIMLRYCASCPVGKKTGKRAVDRDLPWAALRVSQRLQKAKEIADKLESIADDGIVDHMERADFDTALAFLRSLEETITDMLLWAMSRETEKSRPAATETALVK